MTATPPEQPSGVGGSESYMPPEVSRDLDLHYVRGCLWQVIASIAQGATGNFTPQEYARFHLEHMADPTQHIDAVGGQR